MNRPVLIIGILLLIVACLACLGIGTLVGSMGGINLPAVTAAAPTPGAIPPCEGFVAVAAPTATPSRTPPAGATATATAEPEEPERLGPADAVAALEYRYCRWDAAGVLVPVPVGWSAEVLGRISANRTQPGDLGAVRMNGTGALEELTITLWGRNAAGGQSPFILYPNPWNALSAIYDTDIRAAREISIGGKRGGQAEGNAARRDLQVRTYYDLGKAWAFGGSSDSRSVVAVEPLLDQLASRLRPITP